MKIALELKNDTSLIILGKGKKKPPQFETAIF
jgi:hypothetical protein